ncbi:MAG: hypothetical protein PHF67_02315 [Candidatus Nanoarchaeia archaeon]|nr:hypothetical protein [Candidatus Nanoarchaeia archaeon]
MSDESIDAYKQQPRVVELEGRLIRLAQEIPGVINPHGCSYVDYRDFKIHFEHESSENSLDGYLLEFKPSSNTLIAWAGGLSYNLPNVVVDHLSRRFPNAVHFLLGGARDVTNDGFHNWSIVREEELPALTG